jgi:hypothetical protein
MHAKMVAERKQKAAHDRRMQMKLEQRPSTDGLVGIGRSLRRKETLLQT